MLWKLCVHHTSNHCQLMGFLDSSVSEESTCNAGDPGSIAGSGSFTGEGIGCPLQCSWASPVAQPVKNLPAMRETWVGKIPWRRERLPTPVFWPGEFHGLYSPWGCKATNKTERLSYHSRQKFVDCVFGRLSLDFQFYCICLFLCQ